MIRLSVARDAPIFLIPIPPQSLAASEINNLTTTGGTIMPQRQEASLQLAQLWVELQSVEQKITSVILPLMQHLGVTQEDTALTVTLEQCAELISQNFERFKLQASRVSE
jgi:hypothetical protein